MKSGFVLIIGRPNVGKSSLINVVLNYKLAITTNKPQTTRNQIKGIYNDKETQIIFIDTPGIHKPKQKLGEFLNETSYQAINEADIILFLSPLDEKIGPGDKLIIQKIISSKLPKVGVISKIDLGNEELAKQRANQLKAFGFDYIIGVSTMIKESIEHLISFIKTLLPTHARYYAKDDLTDVSTRFMVQEIIRETIIDLTYQEIPHAIGVMIDDFKPGEITAIQATIFVERASQKGVLIGEKGKKIKEIGIISRQKIKTQLGIINTLHLKVKISKNWTKNGTLIKKMGY